MSTTKSEKKTKSKTIQKDPKKVDYDVAIVGAGFSGIGMAIALKKAGINDFIICDGGNDIGGTWRDNVYPGAACDVPSHLYSFSFEQNPNWTRMFAQGDEIQSYLLDVVEKWNLRPHIKFNSMIEHAQYDEVNKLWRVGVKGGLTLSTRNVISACGALSTPKTPNILGKDKFKGKIYHTARWPSNAQINGKTVAVIGSGASAIQLVPAIADKVKNQIVFQRTASWIVPKADYEISEMEQKIYEVLPFLQQLRRSTIFALTELLATAIVFDSPMTDLMARISKWHMSRSISDPELLRKVTPNYRLGCKRMLISNDWYPTLAREDVHLVDHGAEEITEKGVIANGKEYEADVIVFATGYAVPSAGSPFPILGRKGRDLNSDWSKGGEAYKGISVHGYPNMFLLMGPNTGPGHTSVLVYIEAQIQYIRQLLEKTLSSNIEEIEVKQSKHEDFQRFIAGRMKNTTWTTGCHSWYLTEDGRNTTLYPGFASEYVLSVRKFDISDYNTSGK